MLSHGYDECDISSVHPRAGHFQEGIRFHKRCPRWLFRNFFVVVPLKRGVGILILNIQSRTSWVLPLAPRAH